MLGYPPTLGVFKRLTHGIVPAKRREVPEEAGTGHSSATDDIKVVSKKGVRDATILSYRRMKIPMESEVIRIEGVGEWKILVPPTVYPPKEDTMMLCRAITKLTSNQGSKAMEIGCGSGLVSIVLKTLGWDVVACDVNPYAVACTRGNMEANGLSGMSDVFEAEVGSDFTIAEETELIVWNLPYLGEAAFGTGLHEKIEEAALTDIPEGGWGGVLLHTLENLHSELTENIMVILVMRTEPESDSKIIDWKLKGWSCRRLGAERFGVEKIEAICFWKTGSGQSAKILDSCKSTMDEAAELPRSGWQRVLSMSQTSGRGRRGNSWISEKGGMFATWNLDSKLLERIPPGIIQTSIGAVVSRTLGAEIKWPNDIVTENGVKIGGVLVESSNNSTIRVGVGANKTGFASEDFESSGWTETIGDFDSSDVFRRIDREISSLFEAKKMIPETEVDFLTRLSWAELSKSLSRGVLASNEGHLYRPTGLKKSGELELVGVEGATVFQDLGGIGWARPKG
ncbi:MAG: hypothetical protein CL975_02240 [Euryarchaeota archaeon]|nr:hypothetical protein [Euryarchaeota archaeon]